MDDETRVQQPRSNRVAVIVAGVLVASLIGAFLVWRYVLRNPEEPSGVNAVPTVATSPSPSPTPSLEELWSARLQGVTLATSDAVVRNLVAGLSTHPKLAAWLASEDLVRRFVAAVANVAEGKSPRMHLDFARPKERFSVLKKDDTLVVDPRSYQRYRLPAEVFASLDPRATVALYRELRPLLSEAYREIAPPDASFDDTLHRAINELLATPVVHGDVEVKEKVVTYTFADPDLEGLSEAQRHFLRMGPDNVALIQAKLRQIQQALSGPPPAPAEAP